jgi:hypothetical protein
MNANESNVAANESNVEVRAGATSTGEQSPTSGEPGSDPEVGRVLDVCVFGNVRDKEPKANRWNVRTLVGVLQEWSHAGLVDAPVNGDEENDKRLKSTVPAFSLCRYRPGTTRGKNNVEVVSGFVMDLDNVDGGAVDRVVERLASVNARAVAWTTWGSGWNKKPSGWRIVVPFAVDVAADDWPALWLLLTERLSCGLNDTQTKDASRLNLIPRAPRVVPDGNGGMRPNEPIRFRDLPGVLFDPTPFVVEARKANAKAAPKDETDLGFDLGSIDIGGSDRPRPDRVERARLYLERAGVAVSGEQGHAMTMRVVGSVVRGFDLNDSDAVAALQGWNARCRPPWSPAELQRKVREAQNTPDPQGRGRGWLLNADAADDDAQNEAPTGDATNAASANPWAAELALALRDLQAAKGAGTDRFATPCDFVSYADLVAKDTPHIAWLVDGMITENAVAAVSGEPKAAKTWFAILVAVAVALGERLFGEYHAHGPRGVALFLTEDNERNVRARLRGTLAGFGVDSVDAPIFVKARGALDLSDDNALAWLVASVRRLPTTPALVVIDPLRNVMGGLKENDNDDMAKVNGALRALRDVLGTTILYVHHAAKSGEQTASRRPGQRMRGGGALHGGYDAGIHLTAPTKAVDARLTRMGAAVDVEVKAGRNVAPFGFDLAIHDDDKGQCVRADWQLIRPDAVNAGATNRDVDDDRAVLAVFGRPGAGPMKKTDAATLSGGTKQRRLATVDRLIADGRLASEVRGKALFVWLAGSGSQVRPLKGDEPEPTAEGEFVEPVEPEPEPEPVQPSTAGHARNDDDDVGWGGEPPKSQRPRRRRAR